ncbi:MAG: hypothetical protein ACFFFB_16580 [Candidatus Heimdallarchaeota archaeon]
MENKRKFLGNILKKTIKSFLIILYITIITGMIGGGISAGIMTLTPPEAFGWTVSSTNYLGYISTCAFAPFSSLLLFGMAFIGSILLMKFIKYLRRKSKNAEIYLKLKMLVNKIR